MLNSLALRVRLSAGLAALIIAGCSGGSEVASPVNGGGGNGVASPVNGGGEPEPTTGEPNAGGQGGGTVGAPTLNADPGFAWAEVDGDRLEYQSSGGVAYECTVADDRVTVNFQTADGHDLLLQGAHQADGWILSLTFQRGGDGIQYSATSTGGDGTFGVGDGAISYEGKVGRVEDFDVANATKVDARVAVNCASAGGDPTATIGGETYVFALSGAQSVTCEVAPDRVTVRINRLALDGGQLEIDGRQDGGRWIGAVVVYTSGGQFTSPMATDGTGLTIDGSSVEFAGAFKAPDGSMLDGTASATCP